MRNFRLLLAGLAVAGLGMAERPPPVTLRFFAEGNSRDTSSFSTPIKLGSPPHDAYLEKIPVINERQIKAIYPFKAEDGSWGCALKLDYDGRLSLEVVSTERRGTILVGFIATKKANHRVVDLLVDQPVRDGVITIPHGLTDLEIDVLSHQFKVIGGKGGPKPNVKYRMWNPFRKSEPRRDDSPPPQKSRAMEE